MRRGAKLALTVDDVHVLDDPRAVADARVWQTVTASWMDSFPAASPAWIVTGT